MNVRKLNIVGSLIVVILLFQHADAQNSVKSAEIRLTNGKPVIHINDEPFTPMMYALTHAYGGRWSWEEVAARNVANFAARGVKLFQVDLWLQDIWHKDQDELDLSLVQKQVRGIIQQAPDGFVFIRLHVNAPYWWNEENPEEVTHYANGPIDQRKYGPPYHNEDGDVQRPLRASLASEKWKVEASEKVIELCQRLSSSPEGQFVAGLHLAGGIFGEWHYWGFIENDPDTGPAMTKYFRKWLGKKYKTDRELQKAWHTSGVTLNTATVPGTAERMRSSDGFFKDPSKERWVIDYFLAQQEVVADVAEHFCRVAKVNWPRPLITGIFYGYYHMTFNRQTVGGHLFIEKIMNSPHIDYLAAPQTYWGESRQAGGSGNSRGIIESALLHGKLWIDEMDNGFLHKEVEFDNIRYAERYDESYHAILKRNTLFPLMRGIGLWYYDFGIQKGFGWWDNRRYLKTIEDAHNFFRKRVTKPYKSVADALIVWSMDNFYYLRPGWLPISMSVIDQSIEDAMRCGVVFDQVYDFDLKTLDLSQYRAVIFMNSYIITPELRKTIRDKVAQENRTIIWNYLPGFTDGKTLNDGFVSDVTGFRIARQPAPDKSTVLFRDDGHSYSLDGKLDPFISIEDERATPLASLSQLPAMVTLAQKKFKNYTSVFSTVPLQGSDTFRRLLKDAGCFVYNYHNDFTYANDDLLLLHSKDGGKKSVFLKTGKLELDVPANTTWLIDVDTGEVLLR